MNSTEPANHPGAAGGGIAEITVDVGGDGRIDAVFVGDAPPFDGGPIVDVGGRLLLTRFVDAHVHLDKTNTWSRAPNPDGRFRTAKDAVKRDRAAHWTVDDVRERMECALKRAFDHGTCAMRSHIDSQAGRVEPGWTAFRLAQADWRGRIDLEPAASLGAGKLMGEYGEAVARLAADNGAVLGPVLYPGPTVDAEVSRAFDLAVRFGLDLDFHVDENLDPTSDGLARIARAKLTREFKGRVVCGHGCALSLKTADEIAATGALLRDADIGLISLPQTNAYLLARDDGPAPLRRALAPIRALADAGATIAVASDNCQDAFNPAGDYNLVEVWRDAVLHGHLNPPFERWFSLIGAHADRALGRAPARIEPGANADFVLLDAARLDALIGRPDTPRTVLIKGRLAGPAAP